jgi:hypothetical protein
MPRRPRPSGRIRAGAAGALRVLTWSAAVAALAAAGCKSIPPPATSTGGTTGGTGSGGSGSGGSTGTGGSDAGSVMMDKFSSGDSAGLDGACSAVRSSAKLVPLDLYVMMDSSKSMNDTDSNGKAKWDDLKSAMSGFFNDPNSAGFSVALKYFPDEADVPESCATDDDCKGKGLCDQRKACVQQGVFNMSPDTLCMGAGDCASGELCVPVQHCTMGPNCMARNCVADPGGATKCPSDCQEFTRYCRGRDICDANTYATPAVAFGELPAAAGDLITSLNGHSPSGYTPTGPALTGALKAAQKRAMDKPDHQIAVVLVTDGLPGAFIPGTKYTPMECSPVDAPGVADLLAGTSMPGLGLKGTPPIPTFVIGIFGPCDLQQGNTQMPKEKLTTWATAGGTMNAVIVDTSQDVTKQIQDAFKQVQSKVITCQYAIPKNVVGGIDFMQVNVDFSSNAMTTPTSIHYVGAKEKCDPDTGGWYYDVSPDPPVKGMPTQIIACDKSCSDFKAAAGAQVDIALGCGRVE